MSTYGSGLYGEGLYSEVTGAGLFVPLAETFSGLVEEVKTSLQGFAFNTDQVCTLTQAINGESLTFTVDADNIVTRGVIEIDDELIWVQSVSGGTVTVPAWGRGWKGTAKTAHTAGSAVFVSPVYPRAMVGREINNAIKAVYPQLFGVLTEEITIEPMKWQYSVDALADRVLSVEWKWDEETGWMPLKGYELIHNANVVEFPTGKMLSISDPLGSGTVIRVTYARQPRTFTGYAQDFTYTLLPESSKDVVMLGAAARLLPWLDAGRLPVDTVASDAQDQTKPVGNAVSVGREIRSLYAQRLAQEREALLNRYPLRVHKVR